MKILLNLDMKFITNLIGISNIYRKANIYYLHILYVDSLQPRNGISTLYSQNLKNK